MKKHILLSDYIRVADIHAERLKIALAQCAPLIPLSVDRLATLSPGQIAFFDMMTMRFGNLQDVIGAKIFSLILKMLAEDTNSLSFIDKLNTLERLGYLEDTNWWMDLREVRNQVTHDYPDNYEAIVLHLSMLSTKANELLLFWDALKNKIALRTK